MQPSRPRLPRPGLVALCLTALCLTAVLAVGCQEETDDDAGVAPPDAASPADAGARVDAGADASAADAGEVAPSSAFELVSRADFECPLAATRCADEWPSGRVVRFESRESFGDQTHVRTFYVVIPEGASGAAPLWIHLHGGYGSATRTIVREQVDDLASGASLPWRRNEVDCRFDPYASPAGFRDAAGDTCEPPALGVRSTERAVVVFPEGVEHDGARHWEGGRVPSPGFMTELQQRDDLGFLDHVIQTVLADPELPVDPDRVYQSGVSNGGMMTLRTVCTVGDPRYPSLTRIAAFAAFITALPEGVARGLSGRAPCRDRLPRAVPVLYVVGRGFDTPTPDIDGDGFVPWGVPGEVFPNNSPSGGLLLGVEDTFDVLRALLEASGDAAGTETVDALGFYTTRTTVTLPDSPAELVMLGTEGGAHQRLATRMDFSPVARAWDFLARYRLADGQLEVGPSPVRGEL